MAPTTRAQAQGTATPPVPLRLPPDSPRPPPADEWDDDDNDPLLDHVLRVLYPIQSMFARVRESLRHSGYFMFDHLYTLDKECVQELTYPNPDGPGRIPLPAGNRNHLLN